MLEKYNGNYYIAYEDCITDNIYDKNIKFKVVYFSYQLDRNRRIFEKNLQKNCLNIQNSLPPININDVQSNFYLEKSPFW